MVDYTEELKRLREMHYLFLTRYENCSSQKPSEQEVRDARQIKREIVNVWNIAISSDCIHSEDELVNIEEHFEKLATERKYDL